MLQTLLLIKQTIGNEWELFFGDENSYVNLGDFREVTSWALYHSIDLWDVATGEQRQAFTRQGSDAYARALAFSTDGCILASGHDDCVILLWDVDTGKQLKTLTEHTAQVNNLCFSPDSYTLVSGCGDGKVLLWE